MFVSFFFLLILLQLFRIDRDEMQPAYAKLIRAITSKMAAPFNNVNRNNYVHEWNTNW